MTPPAPRADRTRGPSPRVVGGALATLGLAAGIVAVLLISRPAWAIAAALLLALAGVGIVAGLTLLARSSWGEAAWPATAVAGDLDARQLRRLTVGFGAFLLAMGIVAGVVLLLPGMGEVGIRGPLTVIVCGVLGGSLVVLGLRPAPPAVEASERPPDDPTASTAAWVRMGAGGAVGGVQSWLALLFGYQLLQVPVLGLALLPALADIGPWAVTTALIVFVAAVALAVVLVQRRRRPAWVAHDGSAVRHGSREVRAADISTATLIAVPALPSATERGLVLELGGPKHWRARMPLRVRGRLALSDAETALLAALVSRSSIALPHDPHDPTGRFSKTTHPNHVTKAEALAVVEHPPGDGEPLPIGAGPR